ncbi:hypothetical protein [Cytobacillus firmus]|uniref:hypothetical protein n=1 Tax=Cytobacillus firmus TaxID=1399 RepID=UPI001C94B914|nr:hypothetical protein [Cytobacillus firmus]MBY6054529.1 hypothetical protein [Cytobacillus firmus]
MHLDVYTNFATGSDKVFFEKWITDRNTRPDLIGLDKRREWVVIEAKGRTNSMGPLNLLEAKEQTKNIKTINGQYPILRFANSTYFRRNIWNFSLLDPEEYNESAPDIEITQGQFYRDYYSTIYNFLQHDDTEKIEYDNNSFLVRELKGTGIKIGIKSEFFSVLNETNCDEQLIEKAFLNIVPKPSETKDSLEDKYKSLEENPNIKDSTKNIGGEIRNNKRNNIQTNNIISKNSNTSVGIDGILVRY